VTSEPATRPLPIRVRPATGETTESYLRRLARANHLRPSYLRYYINGPYGRYSPPNPERLAALAGRSLPSLQRALADLASRPRRSRDLAAIRQSRAERQAARADLFGAIRHAARTEDLSIRALANRFHVHRRTIHQALQTPTPPARKKIIRPSRALTGLHDHINAMLRADPTIPAGHIWERLVDDHDAAACYATVREYVAQQRASRPS
jgi:TniQ